MLYLAENMRYLRGRLGKSQQKLSDELGITRARYSKYEYGVAEPPLELLVKISLFYGLSIETLINSDLSHIPKIKGS